MSHNTILSQSTIDFLKSLSTGVQFQPGFKEIDYWLYGLKQPDLPGQSKVLQNKSQEDAYLNLEVAWREQRRFVCYDASRGAIWCFTGGESTGLPGQPDIRTTGCEQWGWELHIVSSGKLNAADMGQSPGRAMWPMSSQPPTPGALLTTAANSRGFAQNGAAYFGGGERDNDAKNTFVIFMRAVRECFAFTMAKRYRAFQLGTRMFACDWSDDAPGLNNESLPSLMAFTMDYTLANGGGLLASACISRDCLLYPLNDRSQSSGTTKIVMSPSGHFATMISSHSSTDAETSKWKELVCGQLRRNGLELTHSDPELRWVLLKLHATRLFSSDGELSNTAFYWPRMLCFALTETHDSGNMEFSVGKSTPEASLYSIDPLSWFKPVRQEGFIDAVDFSEQWIKGKADRDKVVDERRKKRLEAEAAKQRAENASLSVPSPLNTREGLHAIAGVYPTPPDGVVLQASQHLASDSVATIAGLTEQTTSGTDVDAGTSDNIMDLDMGPFQENSGQRPSLVSRASLEAGMDVDDDLFGEEDEAFVGEDITDADFNYFDDGPESHEVDMVNDSVISYGVEEEQINVTDKAQDVIESSKVDIAHSPTNTVAPSPAPRSSSPNHKSLNDLVSTNAILDTPFADTDVDEDLELSTLGRTALSGGPASPIEVRKKLLESLTARSVPGHRVSNFDPLAFDAMITRNDAKYGLNGTFATKSHDAASRPDQSVVEEPYALLKRSATNPYAGDEPKKPRLSSTQARLLEPSAKQTSVGESESSSDASGDDSDDEDWGTSLISLASSPMKAGIDQAYPLAESSLEVLLGDASHVIWTDEITRSKVLATLLDTATPFEYPRHGTDFPDHGGSNTVIDEEHLMQSSLLPLPPFYQTNGPLNPQHKDFINVAQIFAEQVAKGFINTTTNLSTAQNLLPNPDDSSPGNQASLQSVLIATSACYSTTSNCDLLKWLCVQETPPDKGRMPSQAQLKMMPQMPQKMIPGLQTSDGSPVPTSTLVVLPPSHVRVRRNEATWDVLPPALPFWETLGLAPAAGRKNVMAFCVYPGNDDLRAQIRLFLDYLSATFETSKLGAHVRATEIDDFIDGMVPVDLASESSTYSALQSLQETCAQLGQTLANISRQDKLSFSPAIEDLTRIDSFVIYMINPFEDDPRGLLECCAAFWRLYETYRASVKSPLEQSLPPDVVLQVLPMTYVASPTSPVVMEAPFFQKFAREVYDRCPPAVADTHYARLPIESAASICLEQPMPRKIDFKMQPEPPSDLLNEGSHMHLGYARSKNGEWLSVAWTDGTGRYQASSSYCLIGGRTFPEVARVIWTSTLEILRARRVAWRLCIAKVGDMEKSELDVWASLTTSVSAVHLITVITTIDPNPPITIYPSTSSTNSVGKFLATTPAVGGIGTPASTPQASGVSPDTVLTPAATPGADTGPDISNDPDAHLVDIGDETWGLLLGHRTNVAARVEDWRPSLSSGFLLKRGESHGVGSPLDEIEDREDGVVLIGVKLVWLGSSPKSQPQTQTVSGGASQIQSQQYNSMVASSPGDQVGSGSISMQSQHQQIPAQSPASTGFPSQMFPSQHPSSQNYAPSQHPSQTSQTSQTSQSMPQQSPAAMPPQSLSSAGPAINKATADSILRDYLGIYRNLGTLARARGLRGARRGALPWHAAVAMRAVEGLEKGFGDLQRKW